MLFRILNSANSARRVNTGSFLTPFNQQQTSIHTLTQPTYVDPIRVNKWLLSTTLNKQQMDSDTHTLTPFIEPSTRSIYKLLMGTALLSYGAYKYMDKKDVYADETQNNDDQPNNRCVHTIDHTDYLAYEPLFEKKRIITKNDNGYQYLNDLSQTIHLTEDQLKNMITQNRFIFEIVKNPSKELCMFALNLGGSFLEFVPPEHKTYDLCMFAIREGARLRHVPSNVIDVEMCNVAISIWNLNYYDIPMNVQTVELANKMIDYDPSLITHIKPNLQTEDMWKKALTHDGMLISKMDKSKQTNELCIISVTNCHNVFQSDYNALQYIKPSLQTDEMCMISVTQYPLSLKSVINKTYPICLKAVEGAAIAIEYVPENLQNLDICTLSVSDNGLALQYIKNKTYPLCLLAVQNNPVAFCDVPKDLQTTELCELFIFNIKCNNDINILSEFRTDLITYDLCIKLVKENHNQIKYVPKDLLDSAIIFEAIKQYPHMLVKFDKKYQTLEMVLYVLNSKKVSKVLKQSFIIKYIREDILTEDFFVQLISDPEDIDYIPNQHLTETLCFRLVDKYLQSYYSNEANEKTCPALLYIFRLIDFSNFSLDFFKNIVDKYPYMIAMASLFKIDQEMCDKAISHDPNLLIYVPHNLQTPEMVQIVQNNPSLFRYLSRRYQTVELCTEIVEKKPIEFLFVARELQTPEMCKIAVTNLGLYGYSLIKPELQTVYLKFLAVQKEFF